VPNKLQMKNSSDVEKEINYLKKELYEEFSWNK
jgi:hypothetical protein